MYLRTVTDVTRHIKALLEGDSGLTDLWVEGEVSNFTRAASGHCYFTLKDSSAELRCVMWRTWAVRLGWEPHQGDWVDAHGNVSVYERGGAYQFYADLLQRGGVGLRWQQFQQLKAQLEAEGLFDSARKRSLPRWPRRIGVVTSRQGAALQDILRILASRYPLVEVVLAPSLVQGEGAPAELMGAIERLNRLPDLDVILLARGGGSLEDLWAFNDEGLARAVAASRVPVVTGVGHETDFTIVDFVADLRMPTPTAAAAAVVPDGPALRQVLAESPNLMAGSLGRLIARWRVAMRGYERVLRLHDPRRLLGEQRQRLDDLAHRAAASVERRLSLGRVRLSGKGAQLRALDPRQVLQRGYAIVQDRLSGQRITAARQTAVGRKVRIFVYRGHLDARVTGAAEDGQEAVGEA